MEIRAPSDADLDALIAFFERVPESERTFFKEPVLDRADRRGLADRRARPPRARVRRRRRASSATSPSSACTGWSDHVGEVRLVVDPEARGQGLGRALARWALLQALDGRADRSSPSRSSPSRRVRCRCSAASASTAEGLLRDHVRDRDGTAARPDPAVALRRGRVVGDGDGGHRRRARVNCQAIRVGELHGHPRATEHRGARGRGLDLRPDAAALPGAQRARVGGPARRASTASRPGPTPSTTSACGAPRPRVRDELGIGDGRPRRGAAPQRRTPMLELHYAVPGVGGVLVPLNTRLADDGVRATSSSTAARKVVVASPTAERRSHGRRRARVVSASTSTRSCSTTADPVDARAPRGRAHDDLDQLHLGHDRQAQGRHDQPPRRLPARARRDRRGAADAAQPLPVDAADVPLQRLGLSVGGHRDGRQARLPAQGRGRSRSGTRSPRRASRTCAPRRPC